MQNIRLVAIDLDGTLLSSKKTVSAYNLDVLRRASARGVHIVIASGRLYVDAIDHSEAVAPALPIICCNGSMACTHDPFDVVFCECLTKQKLRSVVEVLEKEKIYYQVYCDDGTVMESRHPNPAHGRKNDCYNYTGDVLNGDEMPKYVGDGALKLVVFSSDTEQLKRIRKNLEKLGGLEINSSWWDNLEILAGGVTKGAALCALAEKLGVPMEETMAIGDNENDLPMLRQAGFSVAMGNGSEAVKEAADYVTLTNDEDGVGHAVAKFVLGEE